MMRSADAAMDIATIPNPKPGRVCVTVSEQGMSAKVNHPSIIERALTQSSQVEIDRIAIVEKAS